MQIRRSIDAFFTLLLVLLTVGLLPARPVLAETAVLPDWQTAAAPTFSNATVEIWPEYDKPSALVIYNLTLAPTVTLPATLSLRIPAAAGKPYAVAWQSPDKALYDLKYDFSTSGDWSTVKFSSPAQDIRLEYYDPTLKKIGAKRDFTFRWPGDYRVDNLTLSIQQPAAATQMTFRPDAGSGRVNSSDGLTYYSLVAGPVNAGTTFELAMSYNKADDKLTAPDQFKSVQPNQPVNSSTPGRVTFDQVLPWAIGAAGALLIAVGVLWYFRGGRITSSANRGKRPRHVSARAAALSTSEGSAGTRSSSGSPVPPPLDDRESAFCHQCGKKAGPDDVFCRACGTRLH